MNFCLGLGGTVGNNQGGSAVSSVLGGIGHIKGSHCLIEVPFGRAECADGLLVGSRSILKHFECGLTGGFGTGQLDGCFLELTISGVIGLACWATLKSLVALVRSSWVAC